MHILGQFSRGLVVFGAAVHITQFRPPGTLCHDILASLGHIAYFRDSCPGCYTQSSVFRPVYPVILLNLLYLAHQCAFGHCNSLSYFIFAWIGLY